jgi:MFS family permease
VTKHLAIPALLAVATLPVMGGAAVAPAIPGILQNFLQTPQAELLARSIITVPALVSALVAPLLGWLADRLGARRVLYASLCMFIAAGVSGYWMQSLAQILVGRVFLGIAVGGIFASMLSLTAQLISTEQRDQYLGWQGAAMALGGVAFVSIGGLLADAGWRNNFLVYLMGLVVLLLVIASFAGKGASTQNAMVKVPDMPITSSGSQLAVLLSFAFVSISLFYLIPIELPFLVAELGSTSARTGGFAIGTAILGGAISAMAFGKLRSRSSPPLILAGGAAIGAVGYGVIGSASGLTTAFVGFGIAGFGMGVFTPALNAWLLATAPAALRGRYSGFLVSSISIGQFASPIASQPVLSAFGIQGLFWVAAGLLLSLALAAAWVSKSAPHHSSPLANA